MLDAELAILLLKEFETRIFCSTNILVFACITLIL